MNTINLSQDNTPVIIVAGGMDYFHRPLRTVEMLLLKGKPKWRKMVSELIRPRTWYPALGVLDQRLIVASGRVGQNLPSYISFSNLLHKKGPKLAEDTVEEWDPRAKKWRISQTILNWKRADSRAVIVPGSWYPTC